MFSLAKNIQAKVILLIFLILFTLPTKSAGNELPKPFSQFNKQVKKKLITWTLLDTQILDNSDGAFGDKKFQFGISYLFSKSNSQIDLSLSRHLNENEARKWLMNTANSSSSGDQPQIVLGLSEYSLTRVSGKNNFYYVQKNNFFLFVRFENCSFSKIEREDLIKAMVKTLQ